MPIKLEALVPLFKAADWEVPTNDAEINVVMPDSLKSSYTIGVDAEIKNIDMYKSFLKEDLPQEVQTVFESLMKASEKHLVAFERAANR